MTATGEEERLTDGGDVPETEDVDVLERVLAQHRPPPAYPTGGTALDLDGPDEAPDWLVEGLLVRGWIHMCSADTGHGKSKWRSGLVAAGLKGEDFLGRPVKARRFMVIDGENPLDVVRRDWRALGIRNEHLDRLRFYGQEVAVRLGEPEWNEWLRREVEDFRPDAIVIDTIARCCAGVAVNDNDSVARLYSDTLTPIARGQRAAILFMHHTAKGRRSSEAEAALGAKAWESQADAQITLAHTGKFERSAQSDGSTRTRRPFIMRIVKSRAGQEDRREAWEVRGREDPEGALIRLSVSSPDREPDAVELLVGACTEPIGRGELAKRVAMNASAAKFRAALKEAVDSALLVKTGKLYERGAAA